jgi:flagellar biogenesis protein FliO
MHERNSISKFVGRATPCAPWLILAIAFITATSAFAADTNGLAPVKLEVPALPSAGPSILRVMGALALVLGIFFGGVWLYRNWQRLTIQRGRTPKLNVVETRPLGGKHALYVIGYEQERFLVSASPTGVSLLTHLPTAAQDSAETTDTTTQAPPSFAQALTKVLKGK